MGQPTAQSVTTEPAFPAEAVSGSPRGRGASFYWGVRLASLVIVLAGWQLVGSQINPIFLSTPTRILAALFDITRNGQIFEALRVSLLGIVLGFGAAIVIGVPVGILMGRSRTIEAALEL